MSRWSAGSQSALREANAGKIVDAVTRFGGLTQVELAEATALSTATVSAIVKDLLAAGLIETHPTSRNGRRATLVTMARRTGIAVAVHVGLRSMRVRLCDGAQHTLADKSMPLSAEHAVDTVLDRIALFIVEMVELLGSDLDEVIGVCVAVPAPIHPATGTITTPGLMRGWEDTPIAEVMSQRLGCPVYVENDANMAALAEATQGAANEVADAIYVRASHGTGAGIIIGHDVHRGHAGTAGEIGHIQVDPLGAICRCGLRGCLETVVGSDALLSSLRVSYGALTLRDVITLAAAGDAGCARVLADAAGTLGRVVAGLCKTINPSVVVVGGELCDAGPIFTLPFENSVRDHSGIPGTSDLQILPSTFGHDAELVGAIIHILQNTELTQRVEERV